MTFIDLVVSGPDLSGTSTQIRDIIQFFQTQGKVVKDIGGTEVEVLFHAEMFSQFNRKYLNAREFFADKKVPEEDKNYFRAEAIKLLLGNGTNDELRVASMIKNNASSYINPDSADVWIMEEPPRRGAGQVCRVIEQKRTDFLSEMHPLSAAYAHQAYRTDEFLRFRRVLREKKKIIVRSRSEESACYQVYDKERLPYGIKQEDYIRLPGHQIAFANPPTHIFVVHASADWTPAEYLKLKQERCAGRYIDDYEKNAPYQVLVNWRYATDWINSLYKEACRRYNSREPEIVRFNIYDSKEQIKKKMRAELIKLLKIN
jgi:hypothetical protein